MVVALPRLELDTGDLRREATRCRSAAFLVVPSNSKIQESAFLGFSWGCEPCAWQR
jgi:hypothetical protein